MTADVEDTVGVGALPWQVWGSFRSVGIVGFGHTAGVCCVEVATCSDGEVGMWGSEAEDKDDSQIENFPLFGHLVQQTCSHSQGFFLFSLGPKLNTNLRLDTTHHPPPTHHSYF